jgi:hypothetical protein
MDAEVHGRVVLRCAAHFYLNDHYFFFPNAVKARCLHLHFSIYGIEGFET